MTPPIQEEIPEVRALENEKQGAMNKYIFLLKNKTLLFHLIYLMSNIGLAQDSTSVSQLICTCEYKDTSYSKYISNINCIDYFLLIPDQPFKVVPMSLPDDLKDIEYRSTIYFNVYYNTIIINDIKLAYNVNIEGLNIDRNNNVYLDIRTWIGTRRFYTHFLAVFNKETEKVELYLWYFEI